MFARAFATLIFWVLMTCSILGSLLVVVLLYLPFVALKALVMAVAGKISLRVAAAPQQQNSASS